jgi:hypothetical protein
VQEVCRFALSRCEKEAAAAPSQSHTLVTYHLQNLQKNFHQRTMLATSFARSSVDEKLLALKMYLDADEDCATSVLRIAAKRGNRFRLTPNILSITISTLLCVLLVTDPMTVYHTLISPCQIHTIQHSYGNLNRIYVTVDSASDSLWDLFSVEAGIVRIPHDDGEHTKGRGFVAM